MYQFTIMVNVQWETDKKKLSFIETKRQRMVVIPGEWFVKQVFVLLLQPTGMPANDWTSIFDYDWWFSELWSKYSMENNSKKLEASGLKLWTNLNVEVSQQTKCPGIWLNI